LESHGQLYIAFLSPDSTVRSPKAFSDEDAIAIDYLPSIIFSHQ
jgi:hypothetical protein